MSTLASSSDTIAAIATPPGVGGIGIIRLSGSRAPELAARLWRGPVAFARFASHRLYRGSLIHPETGQALDSAMALWMRAPHSYTGDEVVELHLHGSPLLLSQALELLLASGARLAEPGEFTRRAFMQGKMDLLQAEAVGALIHAQSEAALKSARAQLEGRLSGQLEPLRQSLVHLLAQVEVAIDFPEEDVDILAAADLAAALASIRETLQGWTEQFELGRLMREGIRIALVGRPNVGKSSLLNRLVGEDRAIVHERPGTTRDSIEVGVNWRGYALRFFDTAGLREADDAVEREGIARTRRIVAQADLRIFLIDLKAGLTEEDRFILSTLPKPLLRVGNKLDQAEFEASLKTGLWLGISALTGQGIENLKENILQNLGLKSLELQGQSYFNHARHRQALEQALTSLRRAEAALQAQWSLECIAADLREASESLSALIGAISPEDVLDKIFRDFCIGK